MERLFPSEIARLVLGYLKEECPEAANILEAKSIHLIEYRLLSLQKQNPKTTVNGLTLSNILDQYNAVATYIQNKLRVITQSQSISHSGDLIKNLETIIEKVGGTNSDQNDVSVVYENVAHKQNSPENVEKVKVDSNEEQKLNVSLKNEKIKNEKLTKDQEKKLLVKFRSTNYINYTERRALADKMGVSEILIKLWFQQQRNELRNRLRRRYTLPRDSGDSDDTVYEPRPSTSRAADENEMNCSSSSQREKLRLSSIQKPNIND